jgi:hypothetical protein
LSVWAIIRNTGITVIATLAGQEVQQRTTTPKMWSVAGTPHLKMRMLPSRHLNRPSMYS